MSHSDGTTGNMAALYGMAAAVAAAWSLLIGGSLAWNIANVRHETLDMARNEAVSNLNKDLTFRIWATSHGGVYVPISEKTPPNPYLSHIPDRDVETTSGKRLTLMNPAYMLRQLQQQHSEKFGVKGRITSLRPLNPDNAPDAWERLALQKFERGEKEVAERSNIEGRPYLRMIRAMTVEQGCLKCHARQGYKVGDVRGGIGVYVSMEPFLATERSAERVMGLTHGLIWLFGIGAITVIARRSAQRDAERKLARQELLESRALFQTVADYALEWNFWRKPDGTMHYISPACERISGYSASELLAARNLCTEMIHPDDRAKWGEHVHKADRNGEPKPMEFRIVTKQGEPRWISHVCRPIYGESGEFLGVRGSNSDITERKRIENEILKQQSLTSLILDSLPINIFLKDSAGRFVLANEETARTIGRPKDTLVGKSDYDVFPREVADGLRDHDNAVRASGGLTMREERLGGGEGERLMLAGKTMIMPAGAESPLLLGFSLDITELKHVQERLNETLTELQTILDNAVVGIALLKERRFVWVNRKTEEMTGYSREELAGQEPSFLYADTDDFERVGREAYPMLARGENFYVESRQRRKDGSVYWALLSGKAIDLAEPAKGSIWILEDISGRKQAEEDLHRLNETLEQRVKDEAAKSREKDHMLISQSRLAAMGEMIGNIAHQWRQPLNALSLLLNNIQDAYAYNELDRAYLDDSVAKGGQLIKKMSTTIDDFRNFFKPNREKTDFRLADSVRSALSVVDAGFRSNHIAIDLRVDADVTVSGFPNEYAQVVLNILGNAKDAIQERKVRGGKVEITVCRDEANAYVAIRDNGGGIPDEILEKIFDPYFTTREKGTGIGLYMSKMIIETNMSGRIEVRNVDEGAEFVIVTPLADGNG